MIRFILVMAALHLLAACGGSGGSTTSPQDPAAPPAASGGTWADVVVDCQAECTAICLEGEGRTTCMNRCTENFGPDGAYIAGYSPCEAEAIETFLSCTATATPCDCPDGWDDECDGYDNGLLDDGCRPAAAALGSCPLEGQDEWHPADQLSALSLSMCHQACVSNEDFAACVEGWIHGAEEDTPCQVERLAMFDACLADSDATSCDGGEFGWDSASFSSEQACVDASEALTACEG